MNDRRISKSVKRLTTRREWGHVVAIQNMDYDENDNAIITKPPKKSDMEYNEDKSVTFHLESCDPNDCGRRLFYSRNITFKKGVTILIGCNGSGKTTLLHYLKYILHHYNPFVEYSDTKSGRSHSIAGTFNDSDMKNIFSFLTNSEGEHLINNAIGYMMDMKRFLSQYHDELKQFYLFLDGIDSGTDINTIDFVKDEIFPDLINVAEGYGIDLYIICTANNYELVRNMDCMEVYSGKYKRYDNYEDYRNYILKTYQYKIKERKNN